MCTESTFWLHSCPIINQGDWLRTNYPPDFTSGWRVSALVGENQAFGRSSSGISQCWPVSALGHNLRFRLGDILCVRSTFSSGFKVFFFQEIKPSTLVFNFLKIHAGFGSGFCNRQKPMVPGLEQGWITLESILCAVYFTIIFPFVFRKHKHEVSNFLNFLNHLVLHIAKKMGRKYILFLYRFEFLFQQTFCSACLN